VPVSSNDYGPGVAEMWIRYRGTVIAGREVTPLLRAALFTDFGNILAAIVRPESHSYMNADINLHLARLPRRMVEREGADPHGR
jgi:hypothetical protein